MMQLFLTEVLDWVDPKDFSLDNYSNDSPRSWSWLSWWNAQLSITNNNFSLGKKNNLSLTEEIKENTNSIIKTWNFI